jgi:hypothetical protein
MGSWIKKNAVKPKWFGDSLPLDPLIAPMVLFLQNNGVVTTQSCQGGKGHLWGRPTISFQASSKKYITEVSALLRDNGLDISAEVGLVTGYFADKYPETRGWYGQVQWIWEDEGYNYKDVIYRQVIKLVDMKKIKPITAKNAGWVNLEYK